LTDAQFSVRGLVNATTGRVVERVAYDAYGVGRHSFPSDTDGDLDVNADGVIDGGDYTVLGVNPGTTVFTSGMPAGRISSGGAGTGSPDNDVGYCGYVFNHETQDYHVRFRAYAPRWGRWLQRDPAGYVDGGNLLQYTISNPGSLSDAFGLTSEPPTTNGDGIQEGWNDSPGIGPGGRRVVWHHRYEKTRRYFFGIIPIGSTLEHAESRWTDVSAQEPYTDESQDNQGQCRSQREQLSTITCAAQSVHDNVKYVQETTFFVACVVLPGPEDAAIVALPLLRNMVTLTRTADGWKGVTRCGDEVALTAEDAAKAEKLASEGNLPGKTVDLASHEGKATARGSKGHTMDKHVGKDEAYLNNRVANERRKTASTYDDMAQAEAAIQKIMSDPGQQKVFQEWLKNGMKGNCKLEGSDLGMGPIGTTCTASGKSQGKGATVVWAKGADGNPMILTSYPQ
jgi:RHS repeat-associated protein